MTNAKAAEARLSEEKVELQKHIEKLNFQVEEAENKVKRLEAEPAKSNKNNG